MVFRPRLLKAYSETGKELDSLADVVSFGVAPALIVYKLLVPSISNMAADPDSAVLYIPVLMPVCAALRLAKFNIDTTQTTSFKGLPTPANAIAVISVVMAANYSSMPLLKSFTESPVALLIYTVILSLLMITRLPLLSLKFKNLKFKGNEGRFIIIGLVVISFIIFGISAAPLIIPIYFIVSLITPPTPHRKALSIKDQPPNPPNGGL